jgi:acetyl esterase/lipase
MTTPRYAIDPEFLSALRSAPTGADDVEARRAWLRANLAGGHDDADGLQIEDRVVPGPGPALCVRVYRPDAPGRLPAMLYCHGGGFTVNDPDINDPLCREIAVSAGCAVLAVDYRLSPEHPFPAAFDDCYRALDWAVDASDELGLDSARIAVGGASAGGALAAALALAARDRGGPALMYQQLVFPLLDDRMDSASATRFTDTPFLNRDAVSATWRRYLPAGAAPTSCYAAPAQAADLEGLPPAYIEVAAYDPLRDEGIAYASRLLAAGVDVELHLHAGTFHGSMMIRDTRVSRNAAALRAASLKRAFEVSS